MLAVEYPLGDRPEPIVRDIENYPALLDIPDAVPDQVRVVGQLIPVAVVDIAQVPDLLPCYFGFVPRKITRDAIEHVPVLAIATICSEHLSAQFVVVRLRDIGARNNGLLSAKRLHGLPQVIAKSRR